MAGTAGLNQPLYVYMTQTVAGAANNDYTLTRNGTVVESYCIARAAQAAGTYRLSRVRAGVVAAITDAMNAAVDQVVTYQGTLDDAAYAVIATDILRFQTVGAATLVDAVAVLIPPVAASAAVV